MLPFNSELHTLKMNMDMKRDSSPDVMLITKEAISDTEEFKMQMNGVININYTSDGLMITGQPQHCGPVPVIRITISTSGELKINDLSKMINHKDSIVDTKLNHISSQNASILNSEITYDNHAVLKYEIIKQSNNMTTDALKPSEIEDVNVSQNTNDKITDIDESTIDNTSIKSLEITNVTSESPCVTPRYQDEDDLTSSISRVDDMGKKMEDLMRMYVGKQDLTFKKDYGMVTKVKNEESHVTSNRTIYLQKIDVEIKGKKTYKYKLLMSMKVPKNAVHVSDVIFASKEGVYINAISVETTQRVKQEIRTLNLYEINTLHKIFEAISNANELINN
uniref:Uncharacterized protein n=1 Tax=viral metagenome TaxID=1070528 RepID=A0A2V0RBV9_9ZZZZ